MVRVVDDPPIQLVPNALPAWQILVVDDDEQTYACTVFALRDLEAFGRPFALTRALSAAEARAILAERRDFAVILLDVVMETPHAGLELVADIRGKFAMVAPRIIIRTGQPGYAPELTVIRDYDLDGYLDKDQSTQTRLYSALLSALRCYQLIVNIDADRRGLRHIIDAAVEHGGRHGKESFAEKVLNFVATVSHEFRSSITSISAAVEILEDRISDTVNQPEFARIRRAIERLHALIESCAFENRLYASPPLQQFRQVDVARFIRDVIDETVPPSRSADVVFIGAANALSLMADPVLLETALSNLLDNAIKYSSVGSGIELRAEIDANVLVVTVSDRGPGIPENERHTVFEKFYRSPQSATVRGTGLGLHIVRQVAELHFGSVCVAPREGGGSVFTLRLPIR